MSNASRRQVALRDLRILDTPNEPQFDEIVELAKAICGTSGALISLVDQHRQWFKARLGFDAAETPIEQSICVHALPFDDILVIPDLRMDDRTRTNVLVTGKSHLRFYAGAVVRSPNGVPIGALCVLDDKPRAEGLTEDQKLSLVSLALKTSGLMHIRRALQDVS